MEPIETNSRHRQNAGGHNLQLLTLRGAVRSSSPPRTLDSLISLVIFSTLTMHYSQRQYSYFGGSSHITRYLDVRFLLIFIVLSLLCVSPVEAAKDHAVAPNVARSYRFFARCSQKSVQVRGSRVRANAKFLDENSILKVESVGFNNNGSYVRIQSERYKTYICFNSRGGLRVMHNWRRKRCVFREILTDDRFTEFRLATEENWFIGFRENGKPIKGTVPRSQRKSKCYQFTRMSVNEPARHGPLKDIKGPVLKQFYHQIISERKRRTRTRRTRRPHQT